MKMIHTLALCVGQFISSKYGAKVKANGCVQMIRIGCPFSQFCKAITFDSIELQTWFNRKWEAETLLCN